MSSPIIARPKAPAATATAAKPAAATTAAAPRSSRAGLMALAGIAVLGLGAGGWWFATRGNSTTTPQPELVAATTPTPGPVPPPTPEAPATSAPAATTTTAPGSAPGAVKGNTKALPTTTTKPTPQPSASVATRPRATAAAETVLLLVTIPDALPLALELRSEIPVGAAPGTVLRFSVRNDVTVGGERVVATGATATGEVIGFDRKKAIIRLVSVDALDGTKLNIRATAGNAADSKRTIETPGQKSTTVVVSSGATTIGYLSGQQSVRLRK